MVLLLHVFMLIILNMKCQVVVSDNFIFIQKNFMPFIWIGVAVNCWYAKLCASLKEMCKNVSRETYFSRMIFCRVLHFYFWRFRYHYLLGSLMEIMLLVVSKGSQKKFQVVTVVFNFSLDILNPIICLSLAHFIWELVKRWKQIIFFYVIKTLSCFWLILWMTSKSNYPNYFSFCIWTSGSRSSMT